MTGAARDILSPEEMSRLSRLDLIARAVVEGFITGLHRSPYHGFSTEFAEHRQYMSGDSLKYLDWKVYGRTDRMYVKRFEEETNLTAHIILDASGSMAFRDRGAVTKLRYGAMLAAALAYLMLRQRDSAGLVTFADRMLAHVPPRSMQSQLTEILKALTAVEAAGTTVSGPVLHDLAERLSARGLVVIISDLVLDHAKFVHGMKHFRHNGHEVLVFHVLDPAEQEFDFTEETRFVDLETGAAVSTQPWHFREDYRRRMREETDDLVRALHDIAVEYVPLTTDIPFDRALAAYLAKRKRLH